MAETEPGTSPVRARIGNTGEDGRRQPAMCLSHQPRDEELLSNHLDLEPGPGEKRRWDRSGSFLDVVVRDLEMCDGADHGWMNRCRQLDADLT